MTYDAGDHVTSVTDPRGLVTRYDYDGLGQRWSVTSPDTGVTNFSYDVYGRVAAMSRANGAVTVYGYDGLGRRTSVGSGGQVQTFAYDLCANGLGRLCSASDSTGSTSYSYTAEGWIGNRSFNVGGVTYATGQAYDAAGHVTMVSYPDGNRVYYNYTNGVVSSVTLQVNGTSVPGASAVNYRPADTAMSGWISSNGVANTIAADSDGRITGITASGVVNQIYNYDAADRLVQLTDTMDPAVSRGLGYGEQSRLWTITSSGGLRVLQNDVNGNRLSSNANGVVTASTLDASSNRLMGLTGGQSMQFAYDAQGNQVAGPTGSLQYDPFNRLSYAAGVSYYVNPEGVRLRKQAPGQTSYFAPGGNGMMMSEYGSSGWIDYIWLNGRLVGRLVAGQVQAIHGDQLDRPVAVTDAGQNTVWRAQNSPFDRVVVLSTSAPLNIGFPGQYYDAETGYWNNGFRDYDGDTGRYIQSDPIGLEGGVNTYVYGGGNPLSNVDPDGLMCFNFDDFANFIDDNKFDPAKVAAALGVTLGVGTMPKVPSELRGLGVAKSELNPFTSQLSRWSGRLGVRSLRLVGRSTAGVATGAVATGATVFAGFYDLSIEVQAAVKATSLSDCDCKKK
jgi:RHS repeat-associated protein